MIVKPKIPSPTLNQIEELRSEFFKKLQTENAPCAGGFHPKDIERIKISNLWLQRFLEQQDLNLKASLQMLWDTCEWRQNFGTNDIDTDNLNMDYIHAGLAFPHNRDIDGKKLLIFKSKLHFKGVRDSHELLRVFVYWMERMYREEEYDLISVFFDLADTGLSNLDLDYTKQIINTLKYYYPNALNYIFIYELPWILTAAFKIIKALLPPKAVACMRFITTKTVSDYIPEDNLLTSWGGSDDYEFKFIPEMRSDETNGNYDTDSLNEEKVAATINKKVHFANSNSPDSPMSDSQILKSFSENGPMLKITPAEIITFSKSGNELIGTVDILNIVKRSVTYKIKTTSPEKFRVRPSTGTLAPGSSITVSVVLQLQQGHNATILLNKDKFLVMCMELTDANASQQDIAELWKTTQNSSQSVEQHRLKCTIAHNGIVAVTDISRNGNIYPSNGGIIDGDRQWAHVSTSISQLMDTTRRLESRIKFNQKLQWITVFVFLLLSIAIVYILKIEINNNSAEYCIKPPRTSFK